MGWLRGEVGNVGFGLGQIADKGRQVSTDDLSQPARRARRGDEAGRGRVGIVLKLAAYTPAGVTSMSVCGYEWPAESYTRPQLVRPAETCRGRPGESDALVAGAGDMSPRARKMSAAHRASVSVS